MNLKTKHILVKIRIMWPQTKHMANNKNQRFTLHLYIDNSSMEIKVRYSSGPHTKLTVQYRNTKKKHMDFLSLQDMFDNAGMAVT